MLGGVTASFFFFFFFFAFGLKRGRKRCRQRDLGFDSSPPNKRVSDDGNRFWGEEARRQMAAEGRRKERPWSPLAVKNSRLLLSPSSLQNSLRRSHFRGDLGKQPVCRLSAFPLAAKPLITVIPLLREPDLTHRRSAAMQKKQKKQPRVMTTAPGASFHTQ